MGSEERFFPTRSEPSRPSRDRSAVAMLLRTGVLIRLQERSLASDGRSGQTSLVGCEERSFDSLRSLRLRIRIGGVVNNMTASPLCFSLVFILKTPKFFIINTSIFFRAKVVYI